jgi:hypothetical protein
MPNRPLPMPPNTCHNMKTGYHLHQPHKPIQPLIHEQPYSQKFLQRFFQPISIGKQLLKSNNKEREKKMEGQAERDPMPQ